MNMPARTKEINFDTLVGPTHNFGGLSLGNFASTNNKYKPSSPKQAALQGLEKMKFLHDRGFTQAILPPHPRPNFKILQHLGFGTNFAKVIQQAQKQVPEIFQHFFSSSFMWSANTATVSPSADCTDNKLHITPANLQTMFHRSFEHEYSYKLLKKIFSNTKYFNIHQALPSHDIFADEGAANHNRLAPNHADPGLEIFVYGKKKSSYLSQVTKYPARQSYYAQQAIIRTHQLRDNHSFLVQQNPIAIEAGAFHNDVVCVTNNNLIFIHEYAWENQKEILKKLSNKYAQIFGKNLFIMQISNQDLSLEDSVNTYLFNSQILTKNNNNMLLVAPTQCKKNMSTQKIINNIISQDNPIDEVEYFDLSESMANGGGPACLRLRIILTPEELDNMHQEILFTNNLYQELKKIINKYYLENLELSNFCEDNFWAQNQQAEQEILKALKIF